MEVSGQKGTVSVGAATVEAGKPTHGVSHSPNRRVIETYETRPDEYETGEYETGPGDYETGPDDYDDDDYFDHDDYDNDICSIS
jgi:hypothetical protein